MSFYGLRIWKLLPVYGYDKLENLIKAAKLTQAKKHAKSEILKDIYWERTGKYSLAESMNEKEFG